MKLIDYLKRAVADHASDLFVVAGGAVSIKRENRLIPLGPEHIMPREAEELVRDAYAAARRPTDRFFEEGDDLSLIHI